MKTTIKIRTKLIKTFYFFILVIFLPIELIADNHNRADGFLSQTQIELIGSSRTRLEYQDWYGKIGEESEHLISSEKVKIGAELKNQEFRAALAGQYYGIYDLEYGINGPNGGFLAANSNSTWPQSFSLREALLAYKSEKLSLSIGRQNYFSGEGGTIDSANLDLTYLLKWRIAQRVLGASEFTAGRSFDGIKIKIPVFEIKDDLEIGFFRPTEGSGSVDANRQITDIDIAILSYTKDFFNQGKQLSQAQGFYYLYDDSRGLTKTDNRELASRNIDQGNSQIHNFGGHFIASIPDGINSIDTTFWGISQHGDWGQQKHEAWALVAELGYHINEVWWKPWLRGGINITSGDGSSTDKTHSTFFQLINTPRNFALSPFYNMQNLNDQFVQILLYPSESLTIRSDLHNLRLTNENDLLYSGSGASVTDAFGYNGQNAKGQKNVATLIDVGLGYIVSKHISLDAYLGYAWGGAVLSSTYGEANSDILYALVDFNLAF